MVQVKQKFFTSNEEYELIRDLDEDCALTSKVYHARSIRSGNEVAIKIYKEE